MSSFLIYQLADFKVTTTKRFFTTFTYSESYHKASPKAQVTNNFEILPEIYLEH